MGIWSPRSEGAAQDIGSVQGRLTLTPSTLPARHSKSLDQLGPDIAPVQPRTSPKTLPRSVSTQLFPRQRGGGRNVTPPATVPSRGRQRSTAPSSSTLFPPSGQQACSAPNPSLGSTPVVPLPRAKSTQMLVLPGQQADPQNTSITSLLAAMFPELPPGGQLPGYRPSNKSCEQTLTVPTCVGMMDHGQMTDCWNENKSPNIAEGRMIVFGISEIFRNLINSISFVEFFRTFYSLFFFFFLSYQLMFSSNDGLMQKSIYYSIIDFYDFQRFII